jgi:hypothetical protein
MRKPCGNLERTRVAADGRKITERNGNLAVFLGGMSALMGTLDGLACRADLQQDQRSPGRSGSSSAVLSWVEADASRNRRPPALRLAKSNFQGTEQRNESLAANQPDGG